MSNRHHYAALDGLRGVLSLGVILFHFGHWFGYRKFFPSFSLSVDVFFCLSGFVLSFAFGTRTHDLPMGRFVLTRLIRLMPIMALGTLISVAYLVLKNHVEPLGVGIGTLAAAIMLGLTCLPYFNAPHSLGGPQVFPLNGPQYTLSLELFVNILWWLLRRYDQVIVSTLFVLASLPFIALYPAGGDTTGTYLLGFPRILFSFFLGALIFRLRERVTFSTTSTALYLAILAACVAVLSWPSGIGPVGRTLWIVLISPALVLLCSCIRLSGAAATIALIAGELSYPIYALHYPIFCFVNGILQAATHSKNGMIELPAFLLAVVGVSFAAARFYERPLLGALKRTLLPRKA